MTLSAVSMQMKSLEEQLDASRKSRQARLKDLDDKEVLSTSRKSSRQEWFKLDDEEDEFEDAENSINFGELKANHLERLKIK